MPNQDKVKNCGKIDVY